MDTKKTRASHPHGMRRRYTPWLLLLAGLLSIAGAVCWVIMTPSVQELPYGQFKKRLMSNEIQSVKVGPTELTGMLAPRGPGGRPVRFHTSRVGMEQDTGLARLLDENIPDGAYEAENGPSLTETVLAPVLLLVVLIGGLSIILKRNGGMGSALAFARSRPKVYRKDERRVTFADVAGNDEAVAELREVVEFLRTPEKYQAIGGRIPKGVLLVGPPGTGKTLLAKAVAGEAGVPFFALSGSDFVEMFVGVGAARVRSLFAQADAKAPCLIFIDELDALGKSRGTGGPGTSDERDQTLNQLLVQMDGFDANRGIILIAATNRPETLDAALVRPGRFDRQVVVDRPDITGREHILRVHALRTVAARRRDQPAPDRRHDLGFRGRRPGKPGQRGGPSRRAAG